MDRHLTIYELRVAHLAYFANEFKLHTKTNRYRYEQMLIKYRKNKKYESLRIFNL